MKDKTGTNCSVGMPIWLGIPVLLMATLFSCRSMGPKTIPPDGFNYNARIAMQQNEQLLLNIVRLRYGEVPLFLQVSSMINQYSRSAVAGASGVDLLNMPAAGANVSGIWADRPTITYTPMSGKAYSQSLLKPLPPEAVFFLIQSGWSPTRMLRLTTSSINGLKNETSLPYGRRAADPGFVRLMSLMTELQRADALAVKIVGPDAEPAIEMFFPERAVADSIRNAITQFKQLLKLAPDQNSFPVRYGVVQESPGEIVIQTHSMLEILTHISWYIEVPEDHVRDGRTLPTFQPSGAPLLRIRASRSQPGGGFIAIKRRDHWYAIDDRDLESKTTFGVIQTLLSLARDGSQAVTPLISIGN